jgi:hypothetical protein
MKIIKSIDWFEVEGDYHTIMSSELVTRIDNDIRLPMNQRELRELISGYRLVRFESQDPYNPNKYIKIHDFMLGIPKEEQAILELAWSDMSSKDIKINDLYNRLDSSIEEHSKFTGMNFINRLKFLFLGSKYEIQRQETNIQ